MEKAVMISKEESDVLVAGLRSLQITGTLETLPKGMERLIALIRKIQGAFEEDNDNIMGGEREPKLTTG